MNMNKTFLGKSSLAFLLPLLACGRGEASPDRPNIVFFLVDDYGWLDSSVAYGDEVYPNNLRMDTPNMQRLAERGVIMTNAYACPTSSPTRTSLISGMNTAHMRITNFTSNVLRDLPTDCCAGSDFTVNDNPNDPFANPDWNWNGLSPEPGVPHTCYVTPLPVILKDNGYYTIHVGKAHWGTIGTPGASPTNMGYLVNVAGGHNGMPRTYQGERSYGNAPGEWNLTAVQGLNSYYTSDVNLTEALTREAVKALEYPVAQGIPFYLDMSHYGVHTPIEPDSRFYQKYLDRGYEEGLAKYCSMVESVDKSLGDIMDYLDAAGIADNTVIVFYSDNGGHSIDTRKGGAAHEFNAPLREGKGSCYEGGIRVPMLVYIPNGTEAGVRINTPFTPEDYFPTILDIANITSYKAVQDIDGQSFKKLWTEGSKYVRKAMDSGEISDTKSANAFVVPESVSGLDPEREVIFHYPHQWRYMDQPDIDFLSCIRKGKWKVVYRMHDCKVELYDLSEDISERHDVAAEHPVEANILAATLAARLSAWNASMPTVRETGKPVPFPIDVTFVSCEKLWEPYYVDYQAEKICDIADVVPKEVEIKGSTQGFAVSGKYGFLVRDKGQCNVFNLEEPSFVNAFYLEKNTSHCNNACFGPDKPSPDAEFPYFYVSECREDRSCFVYEITTEGSKLVQRIFYDDSTVEGAIDWAVDPERRLIYAYEGMGRGREKYMRVFRLPKVSEGPEVHFKLKDCKQFFPIYGLYIGQGSAVRNGNIYLTQGIPKTDMDLHIFDLDGNRLKALNFRPIGLEPEGIDIQNGWIYVAFHTPKRPRHSNIWRFKLKD